MPITIHDLAVHRGAKPNDEGCFTEETYARLGFAIVGGCEVCGACIAAYNAYPSKSGYWRCGDCIGDLGFESPEEFDAPQKHDRPMESYLLSPHDHDDTCKYLGFGVWSCGQTDQH